MARCTDESARALIQRWYDLYGGSTVPDIYAQQEMIALDFDTEEFLGIESQYKGTPTPRKQCQRSPEGCAFPKCECVK